MTPPTTVTVLSSQYSDGSGYDVVRVYHCKKRASEDMDLLKDVHDGKQYRLTDIQVTR